MASPIAPKAASFSINTLQLNSSISFCLKLLPAQSGKFVATCNCDLSLFNRPAIPPVTDSTVCFPATSLIILTRRAKPSSKFFRVGKITASFKACLSLLEATRILDPPMSKTMFINFIIATSEANLTIAYLNKGFTVSIKIVSPVVSAYQYHHSVPQK